MEWNIDKNRPICPQIEEQICARAALGEFRSGEKLKSVREVAVEAGVNPNTVQKAFSELEREGLIFSRVGSGWYIGDNTEAAAQMLDKISREKTAVYLQGMRSLGKNLDQTIDLVRETWNE